MPDRWVNYKQIHENSGQLHGQLDLTTRSAFNNFTSIFLLMLGFHLLGCSASGTYFFTYRAVKKRVYIISLPFVRCRFNLLNKKILKKNCDKIYLTSCIMTRG